MEAMKPTLANIAMLFIVGCICLGVLWDVIVVIIMGSGPSICESCRQLNARSDGLFALCWLALWVHVFLKWYLPSMWMH